MISKLMPQFAGANPPGFNECLKEMSGALFGNDGVYRQLEQSLRRTAYAETWEPNIIDDGRAIFDPRLQILPKFDTVRPNDGVMTVYVAALAQMHGVAGACRDTMPSGRGIEFFAGTPELWPERLDIVCSKIIEKYKGVKPRRLDEPSQTLVFE